MPTAAFSPQQQKSKCGNETEQQEQQHQCQENPQPQPSSVFTAELRQHINQVLKNFEGTHNFHNFTSRMTPTDPKANRYILSFTCSTPFLLLGIEYVKLEVTGQSFLLHQIRKMIGLLIAIMRFRTDSSVILGAFSRQQFNLPTAPGLGLILQKCSFDRYSKKFKQSHESLVFDPTLQQKIQDFASNHIYNHIAQTDIEQKITQNWLQTLDEFPIEDQKLLSAVSQLSTKQMGNQGNNKAKNEPEKEIEEQKIEGLDD